MIKEKTISAMLGKGSISHNSRMFHATNVDKSRTKDNIEYKSIAIKDAYASLFNNALKEYNDKQTREDRKINDYYEKIRTSKQEKTFHEVIFQIGNKDDTNVLGEDGILAKTILDEFMLSFEKTNPNLYVFSAHLHMDEETPHLHIDFIPFTTNSKRGLSTRVSLKQALASQGFTGGTRKETEWNQWISSQKESLAQIMQKHQVNWLQLGTHDKHLSSLEFTKKKRVEEIETLDKHIEVQEKNIHSMHSELSTLKEDTILYRNVHKNAVVKDMWNIPEPTTFATAKSYHQTIVIPFIKNIRKVIDTVLQKYLSLRNENTTIKKELSKYQSEVISLKKQLDTVLKNSMYETKSYRKLCKVLGKDKITDLLNNPTKKTKQKESKRDR